MPPSRDDKDSLLGRARSAWRNRGRDHAAQTGRRGPDDSWVASTKDDDAAVTDATNNEGVTDTSADDPSGQDSSADDSSVQTGAVDESTSEDSAGDEATSTAGETVSTDDEPTDDEPTDDTGASDTADSAPEEEKDEPGADVPSAQDAQPDDSVDDADPTTTDDSDAEVAPGSEVTPDAESEPEPSVSDDDSDAAPTTEDSTAPPAAARPKPKGGRGIDSATKVIRREDLPDITGLEDLENIDAVADPAAGDETDGEDANSDETEAETPKKKRSGIGPSDSATTVIQRGDLPDSTDLDDLDEIDALGGTDADGADDADSGEDTDTDTDSGTDGSTTALPAGAATDADTATDAGATPADSDDSKTHPVTKPAVAAAAAGAAGAAGATTSAAQGWSTTAHKPTVYPGKDQAPKSTSTTENSGRRRWPLLIGAAVIIVIAVVGGVFAYMNMRPPAPADEAADVAKDFSTALYEGDLSTLRSTTCGERHEFYTTISDSDFQKIYDGQKNRNELVQVSDVKAVKVTGDGDQAVVEVSALHSSKPDAPQTVTINLQKSGDDWKVCTPQ